MNTGFSAADEQFRQQVAAWMQQHLRGEFEALRFRGGPGDEDFAPEQRKAWNRSWPVAAGSVPAGASSTAVGV